MNPSNNQISESKLVSFAIGQQKKSRFQKAREDKELKQKLDDEATAKVYDSFVSSFTEEKDGKTFVRGGLSRGNADSIYGGNRGDVYRMDRNPGASGSEMEKIANEMKDREAERAPRPTAASASATTTKGKRQIDDFLSEIMSRQENLSQQSNSSSNEGGRYDHHQRDRDRDRDRGGGESGGPVVSTSLNGGFIEKGSYDNGDPTTTNLYLGNLAPITTEEHLLEVFGRYGEINSVKIMWPRTEEEKARKRNCGFVSFKLRADAEDALIELQDTDLEGYKMILGWGKAVKISAAPFTLPPSMRAAAPVPVMSLPGVPVGAPGQMFPPGAPAPPFASQHPPPFAAAPGYAAPPGVPGVSVRPPGVPLPPPGFSAPLAPHMQSMAPPPFLLSTGPPVRTAPSSMAPAVPVVQKPLPPPDSGDLSTMSVDSFLDSIIAGGKPLVSSAPPVPSLPILVSDVSGVSGGGSGQTRSRWGGNAFSDANENGDTSPTSSAGVVEVPTHFVPLPPPPFQLPAFAKPPLPVGPTGSVFDPNISSLSQHAAVPASLPPAPPLPTFSTLPPPPVAFLPHAPPLPQPPLPASTLPHAPEPLAPAALPAPLVVNISITLPEDPERQALIDLVARFTAADGEAFEKNIKVREEGNPIYAFLFDLDCQEGQYYRWRTFAYAWGDSLTRWHDQPLQWSTEGLVIAPPAFPAPPAEEASAGVAGGESGQYGHKEGREGRRKRSRSPSHDRSRRSRHSRSRSVSPDRRHRAPRRSRSRSLSRDRTERAHGDTHRRDRGDRHEPSRRDRDNRDHRDHRSDREHKRRDALQREEEAKAERSRYASMTGAQIERERAKKRLGELARLGKEDYQEWKHKLQALDLSRESIKQAMGFAFDKIESAEEIVAMIKDRLVLPSSYGAVKIAGLYLLSDLLHNAGAPVKHASTYRRLVQAVLPEIFENLSALFHSTSGRMSAFNIEDRVKKLFSVWAEWSVFPSMYLIGLQAAFHFTDADRTALQAFVAARQEEDELDGISLLPDPSSAENEALEALQKRARAQGVHFTETTHKYELQFKLEHGEKFSQLRYGQSNVSSISTLLTPYESLIDVNHVVQSDPYATGELTHVGERPSAYNGLTPLELIVQEEEGSGEYDDDIDGVPMEMGEYSIPVSDAPSLNVAK